MYDEERMQIIIILACAIGLALAVLYARQNVMELRLRAMRERIEHDESHIVALMHLDGEPGEPKEGS